VCVGQKSCLSPSLSYPVSSDQNPYSRPPPIHALIPLTMTLIIQQVSSSRVVDVSCRKGRCTNTCSSTGPTRNPSIPVRFSNLTVTRSGSKHAFSDLVYGIMHRISEERNLSDSWSQQRTVGRYCTLHVSLTGIKIT